MNGLDAHLLTLTTAVPAVGALALFFLGKPLSLSSSSARLVALAASAITLVFALRVVLVFQPGAGELQLVERAMWIPTLRAEYFVGVDGLSVLLVLLTALLAPLSLWVTRFGPPPSTTMAPQPAAAVPDVDADARTTLGLVLLLQAGMLGVFTALSFFHWFIYWEMVLVPAFFLVKRGGGESARRAALKFLLYTLVGSVCMLLAFQAMFWATGSLDFVELARMGRSGELAAKLGDVARHARLGWSADTCALLACGGIVFACAVKSPLWPFHTWLPDAYGEAPTSTTLLLTGAMSKMGIYALLRLALSIFPQQAAELSKPLLALALVTVIAGAFAALAQTDLKRMLAYSSLNHVGYCLLGAFAACVVVDGRDAAVLNDRAGVLDGVVLQMFVHGITAGGLFFLLALLEQRTGRRALDDFGGLRKIAPWFCGVFGVVTFASLGLPGLAGFVSELMILRGVLGLAPVVAAAALIGVVITAVFLLTIIQRVWWGPLNERWRAMPDLSLLERVAGGALVLLILAVGILPGRFVDNSGAATRALAAALHAGAHAAAEQARAGEEGAR